MLLFRLPVEMSTVSAVDMTGCGATNANCSLATWQSGAADPQQFPLK